MRELLPHKSSVTIQLRIYKFLHRFFNVYVYDTHTKFCFILWSGACIPAQPTQTFVGAIKIKFCFLFFTYSLRPLVNNVDIYTSTLILCNSLNYNMINTKLCTLVHLLILYQLSELYGQTL